MVIRTESRDRHQNSVPLETGLVTLGWCRCVGYAAEVAFISPDCRYQHLS